MLLTSDASIFTRGVRCSSRRFVGRLGSTKLGAAVIALMWTNITGGALLGGLAGALDTQCTHAHGSGKSALAGLHYLRGCAVLTFMTAIVLAVWMQWSRIVLTFLADDDLEQVDQAMPMVWCSMLGLWPSVMYRASVKWLQAMNKGRGPLIASTVGATLNPILNYALIFHFDFGLAGAAIANSLSWMAMLAVLALHTVHNGLHKGTLPERVGLGDLLAGWGEFFRLGVPAACIQCFEWWSWEITNIIASRLSRLDLAVHGVMLNIGNVYYICECLHAKIVAFFALLGLPAPKSHAVLMHTRRDVHFLCSSVLFSNDTDHKSIALARANASITHHRDSSFSFCVCSVSDVTVAGCSGASGNVGRQWQF
jgi:Na+-driven multidrug efflux pump